MRVLGIALALLFSSLSLQTSSNEPIKRPPEAESPPDLPAQDLRSPDPQEILPVKPDFSVNLGKPENQLDDLKEGEYEISHWVTPIFPKVAIKKKKEGYAAFEFTITKEGIVKDIILLEEAPKGFGFAEAAEKALEQHLYKPRVIEGEAIEVQGVKFKFEFEIEF